MSVSLSFSLPVIAAAAPAAAAASAATGLGGLAAVALVAEGEAVVAAAGARPVGKHRADNKTSTRRTNSQQTPTTTSQSTHISYNNEIYAMCGSAHEGKKTDD